MRVASRYPYYFIGEKLSRMGKTIKICGVQPSYLDYLRTFDPFVSLDSSENRKFVGIILEVNGHKYCAPLSSPKSKHQSMPDSKVDVIKIDGGQLGVINLNNMIPVHDSAVIHIDISAVPDEQYKRLLTNQMLFIRSNEESIKKKAKRLYQIVKSQTQQKLNERCCNYLLLEEAASKYGSIDGTAKEVAASQED